MRNFFLAALLACGLCVSSGPVSAQNTGNVIFFHPDGTALNHWQALRMHKYGPDGLSHWDKLPAMAIYNGHMKDALTGTSNGGATTHAYGVKVQAKSFGMDGTEEITAASGEKLSIMMEAKKAGRAIGIIQTGHIAEPGSAVFVASAKSRRNVTEIAAKVIESGADVIMAGGEKYLLPKGVKGRHGEGVRDDGRNLIKEAEAAGYALVFTAAELLAVDPAKTSRLLGIFAAEHTFNDQTEEKNAVDGKPTYIEGAPSIAEMAKVALAILSRAQNGFFLVAEEEGTDNIANKNNAKGQLEALARADEAVYVFSQHVSANPQTLLVMAADSDAGGLQVLGPDPAEMDEALASLSLRDVLGMAVDGDGPVMWKPFMSAPDKAGKSWPFGIGWASRDDVSGAILVRAQGLNADRVKGVMDNTAIYSLMYLTLFGREIQ